MDSGQSFQEYGGHLLSAEVTPRKRQDASTTAQQRRQFDCSVANPTVIRQDDPSLGPDGFQPFLVSCIRRKVFVVNFDPDTRSTEDAREDFLSQGPVEEKRYNFRRLRGVRSGLHLRCLVARDRNHRRVGRWIPQLCSDPQLQPWVFQSPPEQACRKTHKDQ